MIANDGQFLGKLSLNRFDSESISNEYGSYGSKYSVSSIFNIYSNYGSKYSSLSPYNQYTNTPPLVYLKGTKFGFLTKNKYVSFNSIDPDELFSWMKHHNLQY
ncbi:MAG TPA: hypothetical protein VG738_02225 [Chitinophagaceae bacterium]|nr:hypothetical protein [Chitinophagaceae bacterium]